MNINRKENIVVRNGLGTKLTPQQMTALNAMLPTLGAESFVHMDDLIAEMWPHHLEPSNADTQVRVQIFYMRKRLAPLGILIKNRAGRGYGLRFSTGNEASG